MKNNTAEWINRIVLIIFILVTIFFIGAGLNLGDKIAPEWLQQRIREFRTGQEQTILEFVFLCVGFITLLLVIERVINRIQIAKLKVQAEKERAEAAEDRAKAAEELAEAEKKKKEELSRVGHILRSLMGSIVHDINNGLNKLMGVIGCLQVFIEEDGSIKIDPEFDRDGQLSQELTQLFQDALLATRFIQGVIKTTMNIRVFESGMIPIINTKKCLLGKIINQAISLLSPKSRHRNIVVDNRVSEEVIIVADPDYLLRLFCNLIGNAIKYSHSGTQITITLDSTEEGMTVLVTDQGIGISEDSRAIIFNMYECVRCQEADKLAGSDRHGIGLAVCKAIIEAHDGHINVQSKKGNGSTFSIFLPKPQEDEEE